jgi:hypothetical protein
VSAAAYLLVRVERLADGGGADVSGWLPPARRVCRAPGVEHLAVPVAEDRAWLAVHLGGEQFPQPVDVPFPEGVEESPGEFLALPSVSLEPGPARVHVAARPHRELAARRLRAPCGRRNRAQAIPGRRVRAARPGAAA